ncbi:MAG: CopD family protein [Gammaproteobacteria bacterium]
MRWIIAIHVIFMVTWFAGLFYLPRLFVYHAMSDDSISIERFKVMERKLFWGIMTPGGIITVIFGLWALFLSWDAYMAFGWIKTKLALVALLIAYHVWCGKLLLDFKHDRNSKSHVWYRWFNEAPVLVLIGVVILAVVKPY